MKKISKKTKFKIFLIKIITLPIAYLPEKIGLAFGSFIGQVLFYILKKRQIISIANITKAQENGFISADINPKQLALKSFQNLGRSGWETIKLVHRGLKSFKNRWQLVNTHLIAESLQKGKENKTGFVFITAHCGNWEISCHAVSYALGIKMTVVGRTQGSKTLDALISSLRGHNGNKFIFKSGGAFSMIKALKEGKILSTLFDQAAIVNQEGAVINFLGRPAMANLGPFRLAQKLKTPLIIGLTKREGAKNITTFYPPMELSQNEDPKKAAQELAQKAHDILADFIKQNPDQWLWGHRRWKTKESIAQDPNSF